MKAIYLLIITLIITTGSFMSALAQATLTLPMDVPGTPGNPATITVNAKGISNLVGFQFTIEYDKDKLTYISISNWKSGIAGVTVSTPQEGKITFVYADPNVKIDIPDGKFFDVNFTVKNGISGSAGLAWSDNPTAKSLINYDLEEISCNYVNGSVQIQTSCVAPAAPVVGTITQPSCSVSTGSVVLSGLPSSGTWTLTRTPGNTTSTGTGTSKTITGLEAGTYLFTVTNAEGCASALSANVVVNQPALPSPPVVGNISTNSVTLNGLPSSGTWTITRTPGNINYSGSGVSYNVTPLNPGSYTFTITNPSGCTSSASSPAVISGSHSATLTIGSAVISSGNNVSVSVNANQINDMVGFQFTIEYDKNKLNYINTSDWASGITGVVVSNPQEGKITFVYADPNLKINIADNKFFNINLTLKDGSSGSTNIVWSDIPTAKSIVNYDLEEISCTYESLATSLKAITEPHFQIYPNPFGNYIMIENHEKVTRLKITNVLGQTVIDSENPQHLTNTENLSEGVYFITLFGKDDVLKSVKMVKNSR